MSLFKARDWWSTKVGAEEEFDLGCLCIANIDNSPEEYDKVIIGSFQGIMRVYNPCPKKTEEGWSGFSPEDLLLETSFQSPIMQIEAGRFISASKYLYLAVLQPRKVTVCSVSAISGAVEHGSQYQIHFMYEHNLQRSAFNFCYGPFGGVMDRDFICIQSLDGTVSIFEQEGYAFSRFLPGALIPGPLKYVSNLDSFVTVSSSRLVECYKYQVLAVASDIKSKEESQNIRQAKRVTYDWCFNLGEQTLDISIISLPSSAFILVLGERNIFGLTDTGQLHFMKKIDYSASCLCSYTSLNEGSINYLVSTQTASLLVYQDVVLKWAAKLDSSPVQIQVASFRDIKGVVVSLTSDGYLQCSYLGTDPSLFIPPTPESRNLNYEELDVEMEQIQKRIKNALQKTGSFLPVLKNGEDLQIVGHVQRELDEISVAQDVEIKDEDSVPSVTAMINFKSKILIQNIHVVVSVNRPLTATKTLFDVESVDPSKPHKIKVSFYIKHKGMPADLTVRVCAKYQNTTGGTKAVSTIIKLPLKLVVKPTIPLKNAMFKITIDSNKATANLNSIFPDLLGVNDGGQGSALGFQYYGGPVVTVLASKSQRYRLQSDRYEALWVLTDDLARRLTSYFRQSKDKDFQLSFAGNLPFEEYFELINTHFEHRVEAFKYKEELSQNASQFRAIQRRLLIRFKDKTPSSLVNLDILLEDAYRRILTLADVYEENAEAERIAAMNLSCGTHLMNLLIKLWTSMSEEEFSVLQSTLTPVVTCNEEHGWQEFVDAAITHLLRTVLTKSTKDTTVNPAPFSLPKDAVKVCKHINLFCEKMGKGFRLIDGQVAVVDKKTDDQPESMVKEDNFLGLFSTELAESRDRGTRFTSDKLMPDASKIINTSLVNTQSKVTNDKEDNLMVGFRNKNIETMVPDLDSMNNSADSDLYFMDGQDSTDLEESEISAL